MTAVNMDIGNMLETRMQYEGERQKVLAENVASMGIPGYRELDLKPLDFSNVLASEVRKIDMNLTAPGHLTGNRPYTQVFLSEPVRNPFDVTPTGNNSSTEEEMVKVTQNAADYQLSINLYKKIGNLFKEALGLQPSS